MAARRRVEAGKPVLRFIPDCKDGQPKHALDVTPGAIIWRNTKTGETWIEIVVVVLPEAFDALISYVVAS